MGKNKKKQELAKLPSVPAKTIAAEIIEEHMDVDISPEESVTIEDCTDIIETTKVTADAIGSLPSPEQFIGYNEETTSPLYEADLWPAQPVSIKCSQCGEKRTYKLSQLPKTSDGAFVVGHLQCVRCLSICNINIEGQVLK